MKEQFFGKMSQLHFWSTALIEACLVFFVQRPSKQSTVSVREQNVFVSLVVGCEAQRHVLYKRQETHYAISFSVIVHHPVLSFLVQIFFRQGSQVDMKRRIFTNDPQQNAFCVPRIATSSYQGCVVLRIASRDYERRIAELDI